MCQAFGNPTSPLDARGRFANQVGPFRIKQGSTRWFSGRPRRILPSMAEPHQRITINPQPVREGDEWHVVATWPSGHPEHIKGFKPKPKPGNGSPAKAPRLGSGEGATLTTDRPRRHP